MWQNHKNLNRISENISGWYIGNCDRRMLYYIRYNPEVDFRNSIEYTTEAQPEKKYPDEIFMTTAGKIDLYADGEFGGYLAIGDKTICRGNFTDIFEFKGAKYVIDNLQHIMSYTFRLIKVNDNGTIEVLYNANQYATLYVQKYKLGFDCAIGLDSFYIGKDFCGNEKVFFLCSGHICNYKKEGAERFTDVKYLLIFDPENETNPFIRIDIPSEKVEFNGVSSIWSDGIMLAIGCDREVVMVHLPDMNVEYWTELEDTEVEKILKEKHKYR